MEQRTGELYEFRGKLHIRIRLGKGKRLSRRLACTSLAEAEFRRDALLEMINLLATHKREVLIPKAITEVVRAPSRVDVEGYRKAVKALCRSEASVWQSNAAAMTFKELADDWTTGNLSLRYPDDIPTKDWSDDRSRLRKYILPIIGAVPVSFVTMEHVHTIMAELPPALQPATRRHVQQVLVRLMNIAAYPLGVIKSTPIPRGFLIKLKKHRKAKSFLYPDEERRLLACEAIPLVYRMLWGIMAREGPRVSEFLGNRRTSPPHLPCKWRSFDLDTGMLLNDWNKTNDPRMWAMNPSVVTAMKRWRERYYPEATSNSVVFRNDDGRPLNPDRLAEQFRSHLQTAGITRPELYEHHEKRLRIRAHDLRATFVTLSLAAGRPERWVMARTGHASSEMISRYHRAARSAAEANMTDLYPMAECIPELKATPAAVAPVAASVAPAQAQSPPEQAASLQAIGAALQAAAAAGHHGVVTKLAEAMSVLASPNVSPAF